MDQVENQIKFPEKVTEDTVVTCKFCLSDDKLGFPSQGGNYMVRPCKCEGTVGYVHLECIQNWIDEKTVV